MADSKSNMVAKTGLPGRGVVSLFVGTLFRRTGEVPHFVPWRLPVCDFPEPPPPPSPLCVCVCVCASEVSKLALSSPSQCLATEGYKVQCTHRTSPTLSGTSSYL